ncbi:phosphonate ABC transporter, permease protein PhnE [Ramlibacter sp. H39-3-26]|uniref:phosphonate ABC transporter, permease protein PhnE n=1 Tax=Curvibacter soli TaxID=3031331 RepID=UPI0023D9AC88|nr:phosphonate ABC transporter, permease protein PhnE [Ramlibacter sp. H39-3-26]MDF1484638.1 phosphonate ABC transporter, permease protein PhnE [Ramlibacter sp. H39-3-26]
MNVTHLPGALVRDAYAQAVARRRRMAVLALLALAVLAAIAGRVAEVQPRLLAEQIGGFMSYIDRILPQISAAHPAQDVAEWYWGLGRWLVLLLQTILIAYLGTLLGSFGAFGLSFLAAANLKPAPWVRFACRRLMEFCRTVPDMVFALLFVIAFGIGPMAGVFALAVHSAGTLGKLFSEVVENIDMRPVEGVRSAGGSWRQTVRYAALPQVLPNFASYAMLRFDINVRAASIMGFVGAGGIGEQLMVAIRQFYYTDVSAILLLILATVMLIDFASERMRHALIGAVRETAV